jgi:hypothetical protein
MTVTRTTNEGALDPMNPYAAAFVMFLYQVAVGGLVGLSVTPFNDLERGFYKSTTGVLVVAAVLAVPGRCLSRLPR